MKKEIIKAKRITCCFLGRLKRWGVIRDRFNVRSDWEDFSNIIIERLPEFRVQRVPGDPDKSKQQQRRSTMDVGRS
jgi:hypothetical protein